MASDAQAVQGSPASKKKFSAFQAFSTEHRATVVEELKTSSGTTKAPALADVQRALGKKWSSQSAEVRAEYEAKAEVKRSAMLANDVATNASAATPANAAPAGASAAAPAEAPAAAPAAASAAAPAAQTPAKAARAAAGKEAQAQEVAATPSRKRSRQAAAADANDTPPAPQQPAAPQLPERKRSRQAAAADANDTPPAPQQPAAPQQPEPTEEESLGLDDETLKRARRAGLQPALVNLAGRPEVKPHKFSGPALLAALKKNSGLVNAAKRSLLEGAHAVGGS